MSAFTGFCTLRHLDLNLSCTYQISAGNTKTTGCYLFDCRTSVIIASCGIQSVITFTAFTGIGFSMEMIHGDCQCLMGFLRNRTIGHGTGFESFYDLIHAFYFVDRHTIFRIIKVHQTSQIAALFFVYHCSILFEHIIASGPGGLLKHMNGLWIVTVFFSTASSFMFSKAVQCQITGQSQRVKCLRMFLIHLFCDIFHSDTTHAADGSGEIFVDNFLRDTDGFKNLRTLVRLNSGNTHLGSNLYDTMQDCCIVIIHCGIIIFVKQSLFDQFPDTVLGQIWVDCTGTIT